MRNTIAIPAPPRPFRVSPWAKRIAIFRAYLLHCEMATRHAHQPTLAARYQREAHRLLEESRK
jgi:hypothetical protein